MPALGTGVLPSMRLFELLRTAVADGTLDRPRVEPPLEQALPLFALRREPQEEPCERQDRDDRALDHHHAAGQPLVVERRHPERPGRVLVERVEDRVRPDEDVPEDRRRDADYRDIAELCTGAEPF